MTKGQAFRLGYLTATIGIYFNLVELLGQATQGASVSLAERVQQHVDSLQTQQDAVIANVRRVEELARERRIGCR
ncbi:MAG: hypothetical protein HY329_01360 [Chloroflexi bacterium]|nr:hypothetical protein [Chloroflexota bacterium]